MNRPASSSVTRRWVDFNTDQPATILYKTTDCWYPEFERSQLWNDPAVGVQWPIQGQPQLAAYSRHCERSVAIHAVEYPEVLYISSVAWTRITRE